VRAHHADAMSERPGLAAWVLLGMVIAVAAVIRLRLLDVPLDRDEGEYAYFGQLLLQGVPPYAQAYNLKLPGIYGVYAAILAVFGQSPAAIHLGLLVVNAATTVLVFRLAARLYDTTIAVAGAAIFGVVSLDPRLHGIAAYAEHFVLLPALAGAIVLLRAIQSERSWAFVASGVLFGLAFLVKQSGAAFVVFGVAYAVLAAPPGGAGADAKAGTDVRRRVLRALAVAAGALVPYAVVCAVLAGAGVFSRFWFWTVTYAGSYGSAVGPIAGVVLLARAVRHLLASSYLVATLAAVGAAALVWHPEARGRRAFVALFTLCSLLGTSAGLYFRNQYFVLVLPAVALLAALGAGALARSLARERSNLRPVIAASLTAVSLLAFVVGEREVLLAAPPERVSRELFGLNPFPESIEIARYVRERTAPGEPIAVIGSEPQIYFYAGRRGATGYIYMYPLMEIQPYAAQMQRQLIAEIESSQPRLVVLVNAAASWNVRPGSERTVFDWWTHYAAGYDRVGVADIVSDGPTKYVWGAEAGSYAPRSLVWVAVFERKRS
jgi:hypothetical protein